MTLSACTSPRITVLALFPELLGIGGIQEAGRQTARALDGLARERGWTLQILSLNDVLGEHSLASPDHPLCFRAFGRRKLSFLAGMIGKGMSSNRGDIPLVIAAHPNLALPAWLLKLFSGSPRIIVMTHGVEVWKRLPSLRRTALSHADLVLGPSTDTVQKLVEVQGIAPEKIRKLAWPLNPDFLAMAECPERFPLPADFPQGRVVLTVGRWASAERYKGIDELIHATALLRAKPVGLHLVVVGEGDDLPRLRELASDGGVADSVHFLGRLGAEELAACYANADVFALPSSGEGFGLVFLEAMAFAKPIVGSACGGTTDLVGHGVNGLLVPPGDIPKLADALQSLLENPPLRGMLGRGGAQLIGERYRFEGFKIELAQILTEASASGVDSEKHP